jgi:hypothetical protein
MRHDEASSMNPSLALLCGLLFFRAASSVQPTLAHPEIDFKGALYRAVFVQGAGSLTSGEIATVPEPLRDRLSRFLIRRAAFRSAFQSSSTSFEEAARDARKRALERTIVSLVEVPDVSRLALEFITDAPIAFEWEGHPDGPMAESGYAEKYLGRNPSSPLAPFVMLFIAHRQRAAFEAYDHGKQPDDERKAAAKYLDYIQRARSAHDAIYSLIADDMDRQPYVYLKTSKRPQ